MSEQNPTHANLDPQRYADMVQAGAELAAQSGFDLRASVQANYGQNISAPEVEQRVEQITAAAQHIAEELELDDAYFERPVNTVLLMSIADSWVGTGEKIAAATEHDPKISDERAMLADVALMAAGNNSGVARQATEKDRYINPEQADPADLEQEAYVESLNDEVLAAKVQELFHKAGPNSLLNKQREALNVTPDTEAPFDIKVLKVGNWHELTQAGMLPKIEWPNFDEKDITEEQRLARIAASKKASAEYDAQSEFAGKFSAAEDEYNRRFGVKYGPLPPAYVEHKRDGSQTLYLRTAEAYALIKQGETGATFEGGSGDFTQRAVSTVQHEYGHTQKNMLLGSRIQLGLLLEERKAEFVSHDKLGYQDIKFLVNDLSMVNEVDSLDGLEAALKEPDALSAFTIWSAKNLGLRNTLLLMASVPLPYQNGSDTSKQFARTSFMKHSHDVSTHDGIIRENIEAKGAEGIRKRASLWAARILTKTQVNPAYLKSDYVRHRKIIGLNQANKYLVEAIDDFTEQESN